MPADLLVPLVVIGAWAPMAVLLLALAARQAADWWHGRRQRGRHHPHRPGQRTVEEIAARLRRERPRPRPERAIRVARRTPLDEGDSDRVCDRL